jgi:hypothetical protein
LRRGGPRGISSSSRSSSSTDRTGTNRRGPTSLPPRRIPGGGPGGGAERRLPRLLLLLCRGEVPTTCGVGGVRRIRVPPRPRVRTAAVLLRGVEIRINQSYWCLLGDDREKKGGRPAHWVGYLSTRTWGVGSLKHAA